MKQLLPLFLIVLLSLACKKEKAPSPPNKKIIIEIDLSGDYQNYELYFAINKLTTHSGDYVMPNITIPDRTFWTRSDTYGDRHNYFYIVEPKSNKIVIESSKVAGFVNFTLFSTRVHNLDDSAHVPLKADVKVTSEGKIGGTWRLIGELPKPQNGRHEVRLVVGQVTVSH